MNRLHRFVPWSLRHRFLLICYRAFSSSPVNHLSRWCSSCQGPTQPTCAPAERAVGFALQLCSGWQAESSRGRRCRPWERILPTSFWGRLSAELLLRHRQLRAADANRIPRARRLSLTFPSLHTARSTCPKGRSPGMDLNRGWRWSAWGGTWSRRPQPDPELLTHAPVNNIS